jgi:hypothetical protein
MCKRKFIEWIFLLLIYYITILLLNESIGRKNQIHLKQIRQTLDISNKLNVALILTQLHDNAQQKENEIF